MSSILLLLLRGLGGEKLTFICANNTTLVDKDGLSLNLTDKDNLTTSLIDKDGLELTLEDLC